jgi:type I restriction enzyme S subunit
MTSGKYLFEAGVVLYSKLRPYLKKAAIADFRGLCSADMYPILPKPDELTLSFLLQIFLSEPFTTYAESESQRARMPKLNRDQLLAYSAPLPPLEDQRRIAGVLKEQMAAVEKARASAEAELNTINALPAALLRRAFNEEI